MTNPHYWEARDWKIRELAGGRNNYALSNFVSTASLKKCENDLARLKMIRDLVVSRIQFTVDSDLYHANDY